MAEFNKKPLDFEEVVEPTETKNSTRGSLLELIPISLIVMGLILKNRGIEGAYDMLAIAGGLASLIYLLFSWYMFKVDEYKRNEVILSILAGLIFPMGIVGLVFFYQSWAGATRLMYIALISAAVLFVLSLILFIINIKNERASVFYRNLLTRLLIFSALLVRLHPDIHF